MTTSLLPELIKFCTSRNYGSKKISSKNKNNWKRFVDKQCKKELLNLQQWSTLRSAAAGSEPPTPPKICSLAM